MRQNPSCPACRNPFVNETGRFSICKKCPYREPPKPTADSAKRLRVCGRDCAFPGDNIIRKGGVYRCARCPYGQTIDEAAARAGHKQEIVYKVPRVDWKSKYLKLVLAYNELLSESTK